MTSPIILILGAGPNIGQSVAKTFLSKGYKVALATRSAKETESTSTQLNIKSDFSIPSDVESAFKKTTSTFGAPSVVVYNVSASTLSKPEDPFGLSLEGYQNDLNINVTSLFVAAQQAVAGFRNLPASASKTFIMTGNILNVGIIPGFISQGLGKSAGAHMMWAASEAYKKEGFKFYYGDERKADGSAKYRVDGEAHAELYLGLAEQKEQGPWMQTFVKGKGYQKFEENYGNLNSK